MMIGRVTGYEIGTNKEGEEENVLLQVEMTEEDDIQTVELYGSGGRDYNPPTNATVIVIPIADALQIAVAVNDGITPESEPGDAEIYSVDKYGGSKQAKVKCFKDGRVKLNNGGKGAARKEDEIQSTPVEDPTFWTFLASVGAALSLTAPQSLTGKITGGSDTVEIGD